MAFRLKEIADKVGGEVIGDDQVVITGIASLRDASKGDVSFFADRRYKDVVETTKADALLVSKTIDLFQGPQVIVSNPALAYARIAGLFAPPTPKFSGLSPNAFIHRRRGGYWR